MLINANTVYGYHLPVYSTGHPCYFTGYPVEYHACGEYAKYSRVGTFENMRDHGITLTKETPAIVCLLEVPLYTGCCASMKWSV